MSIKAAILEKNGGNEVDKNEYTNLIMDDMPINEISDVDKQFLEGFTECQFLSLNSTGLKNISNLPKMPKLERLELCDNGIELGCDIIATQYPELRVLKLSGNKLSSDCELKHLAQCLHLESVDIQGNPVCEGKEADALRQMLPSSLEILNNFNKEGQEVLSDEEDDDDEDDDDEERAESASEMAEDDDPGANPEDDEEYGEEEDKGEKRQKLVSGGDRVSDNLKEKPDAKTATVA